MAALTLRIVGATLALAIGCVGLARAEENVRLGEQDVKAGLLYNFLRYTGWPQQGKERAMVVCLYGRDPFGGQLTAMGGRTVNQRAIEVRRVSEHAQTGSCSLLFVNAESRAEWPRLRDQLAKHSVLTVSDYDGFARSGGMIEFTRANNRVGIRVNVDAATAANLTVQDQLLRLASIVRASSP